MTKITSLILIFLIVIALWLGSFFIITYAIPNWEHRGQFGDLFGSVNALFSGLAFAGLIYTIFLQRKELSLQRDELKLQREEMAKSREELAEQADILKAQFNSSIAHLKISAIQTRIEAIKIESLQRAASARTSYADQIHKQANLIENIATQLERQHDNS